MPYAVDGLGVLAGKTGSFVLLTLLLGVLALWSAGYAIRQRRRHGGGPGRRASVGNSQPVQNH